MQKIKKLWNEQPIILILGLAIVFRLIAILFAKGYGMSDDHFLVLEWAQSWLDGSNVNRGIPAGHSVVYPGLHYLLMFGFKKMNFYNPEVIMYLVRFLHGALSLLTVYFGYKLILLRESRKIAAEAGLLLAILWLFPFMSVRNLIEMVCIPFSIMAFYSLMRYEDTKRLSFTLISGLLFGLAFVFRYQTNLFVVGVFVLLLLRRDFRATLFFTSGFFISTFLIQGTSDWIFYGYPYASFLSYYLYNSTHALEYTTGAWYVYIFTIMGVLIPPASLFIMFGFLRQWKKWAIVFWPTLLFLIFHSIYPNKQERFILPAIPLVILAGIAGWREFVAQSSFWQKRLKLHSVLWKWFWAVNICLLIVVSGTYSKKARVEVMNYLRTQGDVNAIVVETSDVDAPLLPLFYLNKKVPLYQMTRYMTLDSVRAIIINGTAPNYLVMMNKKRMDERLERLNQLFPDCEKLVEISPSLIDQLLHFLNPKHNVNQRCYIYRIGSIRKSIKAPKE